MAATETLNPEQRQAVCDAWNAAFRSHEFEGSPLRCVRCGMVWSKEADFDAVIEDTETAKDYHCKERSA